METEGVKRIFDRSEERHKLRYTEYYEYYEGEVYAAGSFWTLNSIIWAKLWLKQGLKEIPVLKITRISSYLIICLL